LESLKGFIFFVILRKFEEKKTGWIYPQAEEKSAKTREVGGKRGWRGGLAPIGLVVRTEKPSLSRRGMKTRHLRDTVKGKRRKLGQAKKVLGCIEICRRDRALG